MADFNSSEKSLYKSSDWDMIEKHKLGAQVKVNIENLINPKANRQVRALDESHVESLKIAFRDSFKPAFTTLVGLVVKEPGCTDEYRLPGKACVEVIGGNHTRVALQSMQTVDYVYMELYKDLTDSQALTLGMEHNKIHEHAKIMTFEDNVRLFRNVLLMNRTNHSDKTNRQISVMWRSDLCGITGKSKKEINNIYKIHLHLAALEEEDWNALSEVFKSFNQNKIKGQRRSDQATQYVFMNLIRIQNSSNAKSTILLELASGEITIPQFRSKCKSMTEKMKNDFNETDFSVEEPRSPNTDGEECCEISCETKPKHQLSRAKMLQTEDQVDILYIKTCLEKEKELRRMALSTIEVKDKQLKERDRTILELEKREKEMSKTYEETISIKDRDIAKFEKHLQNLNMKMESLKKELTSETLRCQAAEETAARARSQLKQINTAKCSRDSTSGIKRKNIEVNETDIFSSKKQPSATHALTLNVQEKVEELQDDMVETDFKEEDDIDESTRVMEEVELGLVEYNRGKVYYVQIKDNRMMYCNRPIGQIRENTFLHQPTQQSFTLNMKDVQAFDETFIICRMLGFCKGTCILVDKMSSSISEQLSLIKDYISM